MSSETAGREGRQWAAVVTSRSDSGSLVSTTKPRAFETVRIPAGLGTAWAGWLMAATGYHIAIANSYNRSMQVSVAEAKNKLPKLIKRAEGGERVTICRRGRPVADLVRSEMGSDRKPKLGTLKGKIKILDPNWWKPMTEEETERFLAGRY